VRAVSKKRERENRAKRIRGKQNEGESRAPAWRERTR